MEKAKRTLGRRGFLSRSAQLVALGSAAVTGGGAAKAGPQTQQQSQATTPDFIIDSHIHCGGTDAWVDEMVRMYRPRKAMACVLTRLNNMDLMKKAIADYPDLFVG
ncbi:MAG: hypothetical protein EHM23_36180, partial [Acidobacteria bacterium]